MCNVEKFYVFHRSIDMSEAGSKLDKNELIYFWF